MRHDLDPSVAHRVDRRTRERLRIDVPLVGQPGLDDDARTIAKGRCDNAVLDTLQSALGLEQIDHAFAARKPVETDEFGGDQAVGGLHHIGLGIEHVEHVGGRKPRALADLEIVEVMPRRDLDRARPELGIGVVVGDDRDQTAGERQPHLFADQCGVAFVGRIHRDRHIGEHRFGSRRRDADVPRPVGKRIAQVPELALQFARFDLEIADRGLQARIPVDEALVPVEQPFVVEIDEHLHDRL